MVAARGPDRERRQASRDVSAGDQRYPAAGGGEPDLAASAGAGQEPGEELAVDRCPGDRDQAPAAGDELWIPANAPHRLSAGDQPVRVLEIAFGNWQQDDILRLADDYARWGRTLVSLRLEERVRRVVDRRVVGTPETHVLAEWRRGSR